MKIENPTNYFDDLGDLHDGKIITVNLDEGNNSASLKIEDLHCNFQGLPEYQGLMPVEIIFEGITEAEKFLDLRWPATIYTLEIFETGKDASLDVDIKISPEGRFNFQCSSVSVEPCKAAQDK